MRVGVTLRMAFAGAALAACAAVAQEADDDDTASTAASHNAAIWALLLDPTVTSMPKFDFLTGGMPDRMLYFSGIEAHRWSLAAYTGAQWAPARIDREGFVLRMLASDSLERYTTRAHSYHTNIFRGAVMPGYKLTRGKFEFQLLGGPAVELDAKSTDRASPTLRIKLGAQISADLWWEPIYALMLQTSVTATTIDSGFSTRAAAGWRLLDRFWIGPELAASRDYFSSQYRIGAHLTGLRTGEYEWSIATGRVWDSYQREGVYARIGVVIRPPRPMHLD